MHYVVLVMAVPLAALVWAVAAYNRLTALRNRVRSAFAQIDAQLKRRHELIPNLVEIVKGYMQHERQTLEAVVAARNQAVAAGAQAAELLGEAAAVRVLMSAERDLTRGLTRLLGLSEAYPQLKAAANMANLMEELTTSENRVAFARQAYNDAVTAYNIARLRFPQSLAAGACGFAAAELFEIELPTEREAVRVSLSTPDRFPRA